jgi:hypothetical protein
MTLVEEINELLDWLEKQHGTSPGNYADEAVQLLIRCKDQLLAYQTIVGDLTR